MVTRDEYKEQKRVVPEMKERQSRFCLYQSKSYCYSMTTSSTSGLHQGQFGQRNPFSGKDNLHHILVRYLANEHFDELSITNTRKLALNREQ